jgi:2-amino-4-hydroxy-6-hydroxymethyldihydropteridine diphosphokinase
MKLLYLILGGNTGDRETILQQAIQCLAEDIGEIYQISSLYETEPWGMENADNFLNQVVVLKTELFAFDILDGVLKIEKKLGRVRDLHAIGYQSRPIDIDILFLDSEIIQTSQLTIPHPEIQNRNFVLVPFCEIDKDFMHPVLHETVGNLLNKCNDPLKTTLFKLNKY